MDRAELGVIFLFRRIAVKLIKTLSDACFLSVRVSQEFKRAALRVPIGTCNA